MQSSASGRRELVSASEASIQSWSWTTLTSDLVALLQLKISKWKSQLKHSLWHPLGFLRKWLINAFSPLHWDWQGPAGSKVKELFSRCTAGLSLPLLLNSSHPRTASHKQLTRILGSLILLMLFSSWLWWLWRHSLQVSGLHYLFFLRILRV